MFNKTAKRFCRTRAFVIFAVPWCSLGGGCVREVTVGQQNEDREIIDTGTAPEVFVDDLGEIIIMDHHVTWVGVRFQHGQKVVNLKVITPLSAVPNIAAQMVAAFAGTLTRRVTDKLRMIAGFSALG